MSNEANTQNAVKEEKRAANPDDDSRRDILGERDREALVLV
jgi:hypothetical protein